MGTVTELGGRRFVTGGERRRHLRRRLRDSYRDDRRYRNIIEQELRPLWRAARCDVPALVAGDNTDRGMWLKGYYLLCGPPVLRDEDMPEGIPFLELVRWCREGRASSGLVSYVVEGITKTVTNMGLIVNGQPAPWVGALVHAHVLDSPPPFRDGDDRSMKEVVARSHTSLQLRLDVTTEWAIVDAQEWRMGVCKNNGAREDDGEDDGEDHYTGWHHLSPDPGLAFDRYEELKATVIRAMDEWWAKTQARREEICTPVYARALRKQEQCLPQLRDYLFHGVRILDPAEHKRLRRLATVMGLDWPRSGQKQPPKTA